MTEYDALPSGKYPKPQLHSVWDDVWKVKFGTSPVRNAWWYLPNEFVTTAKDPRLHLSDGQKDMYGDSPISVKPLSADWGNNHCMGKPLPDSAGTSLRSTKTDRFENIHMLYNPPTTNYREKYTNMFNTIKRDFLAAFPSFLQTTDNEPLTKPTENNMCCEPLQEPLTRTSAAGLFKEPLEDLMNSYQKEKTKLKNQNQDYFSYCTPYLTSIAKNNERLDELNGKIYTLKISGIEYKQPKDESDDE